MAGSRLGQVVRPLRGGPKWTWRSPSRPSRWRDRDLGKSCDPWYRVTRGLREVHEGLTSGPKWTWASRATPGIGSEGLTVGLGSGFDAGCGLDLGCRCACGLPAWPSRPLTGRATATARDCPCDNACARARRTRRLGRRTRHKPSDETENRSRLGVPRRSCQPRVRARRPSLWTSSRPPTKRGGAPSRGAGGSVKQGALDQSQDRTWRIGRDPRRQTRQRGRWRR